MVDDTTILSYKNQAPNLREFWLSTEQFAD